MRMARSEYNAAMRDFQDTLIFAVHGLGGHSGWFNNLRDELAKQGVGLVAYDLPGFGLNHSEAGDSLFVKGHIDSYKEWIDFTQRKLDQLIAQNPDKEITVLGHSLGAVVACSLDLSRVKRFILSVPGFKGAKATFNPRFVFKVLWHYFFDKLILKKDIFLTMPVSEKSQNTPAMSDPLRVGVVSQNLLIEILKLGKFAEEKFAKIQNKVLMIQIESDQVVDNQAQDKAFAKLATLKKQKKIYSGCDHDWIWSDRCPEIAQDILKIFH